MSALVGEQTLKKIQLLLTCTVRNSNLPPSLSLAMLSIERLHGSLRTELVGYKSFGIQFNMCV